MKLYRIVDDNELQKALSKGFFEPTWQYYEENQGWAIFGRYSYRNTFSYDQNQNLHFYPFSIDAVQYLYIDRNKNFDTYNIAIGDSFCVFDIPDKLLIKGYGFYPNKVAPEYITKKAIPIECLLWHTKNKSKMFEEILVNIEEINKWYSTTGKAFQMIIDEGISPKQICGVRTTGGFIYSFGDWFSNALLDFITSHNVEEIMSYCYYINDICYKDLDFVTDRSVLSDIRSKYKNSVIKSPQEISVIFQQLENKYVNKKINIDVSKPRFIAK